MKDPFKLDFRLGINLEDPVDELVNGEMQVITNLMPRGLSGEMSRRPTAVWTGRKQSVLDLTVAFGSSPSPTIVSSVRTFQVNGRTFLALHALDLGNAEWRLWIVADDGTYQVFAVPAQELPPNIVQFGRFAYIITGQNLFGYAVLRAGPSAVSPGWELTSPAFAGTGNANLFPRLVTSYAGRTVWGNFQGLGPRSLIWGDIIDPLTVGNGAFMGTTNRAVTLPGAFEDELQLITEVYLNAVGNKTQSVLLALTKTQCFIITGEPAQTTDSGSVLGTLQINKMNVAAGCVAPNTYAVSKFGSVWVGEDEIWFMPLGGQPLPIGKKIASQLRVMNPRQRWQMHAVMDGDIYKLALPTEDVGGTWDFTSAAYGCKNQWWLDLRGGPPQTWKDARWFGPHQYKLATGHNSVFNVAAPQLSGTFNLFTDQTETFGRGPLTMFLGINHDSVSNKGLKVASLSGSDSSDFAVEAAEYRDWIYSQAYSVGDVIITARSVSNVAYPARWRVTTAGTSAGYLSRPDFWAGVSPITDNTVVWTFDGYVTSRSGFTGIDAAFRIVTPEITGGDPGTEKMFQGAEFSIALQQVSVLTLTASLDRGAAALSNTRTTSGSEVGGIVIGSFVFGASTALNGKFVSGAIYIDGTSRTPAAGAHFELTETVRFAVPACTFAGSVDNGGDEYQFSVVYASPTNFQDLNLFLQQLDTDIRASLIANGLNSEDAASVRVVGGSSDAPVVNDTMIGLSGNRPADVPGTSLVMLGGSAGDNDGWAFLGCSDVYRLSGVGNGFPFIPFAQLDQRQIGDLVMRDFRVKARPFKRRPV